MSPIEVLDIGRSMLWLITMLVAPILGVALAMGLAIGVIQAATQIQEMTLSFIPKLAAVAAVLFWVGPWMLTLLVDYTLQLFTDIPSLLG
ncbi:MAG: flagellar biosynthesis protein FliQ [Proteobacteria bacterium]|nr:flagellar biosynthesis protein FliQ [Pseudomonadota bacterium]